MKVVLLGATGFAGRNVAEMLREKGVEPIEILAAVGLDLRDVAATTDFLKKHRPDFVETALHM
ncbi:MAG: NAD-dependent epimerase/dehydratase family protein [Hymenobacter sp.]